MHLEDPLINLSVSLFPRLFLNLWQKMRKRKGKIAEKNKSVKTKLSKAKIPTKSPKKTTKNVKTDESDDILKQSLFYGYEDEMLYLKTIINNLFDNCQASSLLVCGDCGVGKTTLIDACLSSYSVLSGEPDQKYGHLNVVQINLDGYLQGKNDLAALRQIGRRLNTFVNANQQVLIEDLDKSEAEQTKIAIDSIPKIMDQLRYLTEHFPNFRVIVVLENFEVFCRRQQTLLYNMLDLTQHGRSVLVIGITTRLDCIELLEKRVRSRMSQRIINLITPFKTIDSYRNYCHLQAKMLAMSNESLYGNIQCRMEQFENEISKSFAFNRSFDEVKRMIQEFSFVPVRTSDGEHGDNSSKSVGEQQQQQLPHCAKQNVPSTIFLHQDPKIVDLSNLTKNELVLLIVATRHLRNQNLCTFTCKQLFEWGTRVIQLKSIRFQSLIKSIYKMIELDLLIVSNENNGLKRLQLVKEGQLWITPFSKLLLNISDFQLNELIKSLGNKVPSYIKQLLN